MTLIYELDLDIPAYQKMNFLGQGVQKLEHYHRELRLEALPSRIRRW